ncbi:MAG: prolyl oligopeptidase family serine peptidase [Propionibacteriaceae bacterium]|jgi:dipeptidyl aminopeptidase/acylaminoacyl peptidase|nr:prolyl oligopeptidase family serine peptidase [Propionibacteriaceae bacterium]
MESAYGRWDSPLTAAELAQSSVSLFHTYPLVDGDFTYFTVPDPLAGGRVGLFRKPVAGGEAAELLPGRYIRSAVNEYGGGDWAVSDGLVAYSDWPSGDLRLLRAGQDILLAPGGDYRYGSLSLSVGHGLVLALREDHSAPGEPQNTIVGVPLDGGPARVLAQGADFYSSPTMSADGRLAWVEWDHPNMPWDETRVVVDGEVAAGGASNLFPQWADGALAFISDESGYWNFWRWDGGKPEPLFAKEADFCGPMWNVNPPPYTVIDGHRLGCLWYEDGLPILGVLNFGGEPSLTPLQTEAVAAGNVMAGHGPRSAVRLGYPGRPSEFALVDWEDGTVSPVYTASSPTLAPEYVSTAEQLVFQGAAGAAYAWYYPPKNPAHPVPAGPAPVLVLSHGGPTGFSDPSFSPSIQFWTTRGFAVLDVNYSGSTMYGREFRERLLGKWGILDVSDCVDAVKTLVDSGLADPKRLYIKGSSAGGYTTLQALTNSDVFAGGISVYGVADAEALATDTHKFESRYLDGLIAPYPEGRAVYLERSPIHHLDRLNCPMLILQGEDDKVVPPSQAIQLAKAVRAKGLPVTLRLFPGEGHGFRKAETVQAVLELSLEFLNS